jgi:hypothetical protein
MAANLNPRQAEHLALLARPPGGLPTFDPQLACRVEARLTAALDVLAKELPADAQVTVTKAAVSGLTMGECEARYVGDRDSPFTWNADKAKGTAAHRMIQHRLTLDRDVELHAGDAWDRAVAAIVADEFGLGPWLRDAGDLERTELRALATELYQSFVDGFPWPAISRQWLPTVEARSTWAHGPFKTTTKVDVQFGKVYGDAGGGAGRGLIELKSGKVRASHWVEGEHYALANTLRTGVPPRILGIMSLDMGRLVVRPVTEDMILGAADRFIAAARVAVELAGGREPERVTSPLCAWCDVSATCEPGRVYLRETGRTR